ncbi:hypothetical protein J4204_05320 [Candidatus Woesearchaeota archaeon]|nr:hypothetical protein [Candidatus Woesearchaeota archaeon]
MYNKILLFAIISVVIAAGCSKNPVTWQAVAEPNIYEETPAEQQNGQLPEQAAEPQNDTITSAEQEPEAETEETPVKLEINDKFKFSPESIVITQHNISLSLDKIKHEIKDEYWGKITGITSTILNNGSHEFKPKLLVLMYDEEDFKEEWLKPKAEIEFDIEKLYPGEHTTRDAIINIGFDDNALTKHFKLVLVDAADPANKPIVVVEKEFNPLFD